jgi:hypothetical protein
MKFPAPSYAMRRLTPRPAGSGFAAMAPVATATCSWEAGETHAPRAPAKRQTEQRRINIRLFRFEMRSSSAVEEERLSFDRGAGGLHGRAPSPSDVTEMILPKFGPNYCSGQSTGEPVCFDSLGDLINHFGRDQLDAALLEHLSILAPECTAECVNFSVTKPYGGHLYKENFKLDAAVYFTPA